MRFAGVRHAACYPLWTAQLLASTKTFEGHGIIGNAWLNRWGLHGWRVMLAHRIAQQRRRSLASRISEEDRRDFERDGFVLRHDFLPSAEFAALLQQIRVNRCSGREKQEGDSLVRKIDVNAAALAAMPGLGAVHAQPHWHALIAYAGATDAAPAVHLQSILRHAADGPRDPQTQLHADTFHPTAKAWLFLTDVTEDGGPFTYVPGSHRLTPARLAWEQQMSIAAAEAPEIDTREGSFRIAEAELAALGLPPPRSFAVPANTLVVADTFGFHARGPSRGRSLRVELWARGKRSPFLPWPALDSLLARQASQLRPSEYRPRPEIAFFDAA